VALNHTAPIFWAHSSYAFRLSGVCSQFGVILFASLIMLHWRDRSWPPRHFVWKVHYLHRSPFNRYIQFKKVDLKVNHVPRGLIYRASSAAEFRTAVRCEVTLEATSTGPQNGPDGTGRLQGGGVIHYWRSSMSRFRVSNILNKVRRCPVLSLEVNYKDKLDAQVLNRQTNK
jgi:hypothetical protein